MPDHALCSLEPDAGDGPRSGATGDRAVGPSAVSRPAARTGFGLGRGVPRSSISASHGAPHRFEPLTRVRVMVESNSALALVAGRTFRLLPVNRAAGKPRCEEQATGGLISASAFHVKRWIRTPPASTAARHADPHRRTGQGATRSYSFFLPATISHPTDPPPFRLTGVVGRAPTSAYAHDGVDKRHHVHVQQQSRWLRR